MKYPATYPPGISIILPAYNEEDSIETAVTRSYSVLKKLDRPHEVIVVDDGSRDHTAEICRRLRTDHPSLRLIEFGENKGYGVALRTGFLAGQYSLVFYTDSDNQFDVSELKYLLPLMDSYDIVVGFRIYRYDRPLRLFLSWGYNRLIRWLFRIRLHDIDCSFKVFRREIFDRMELTSTDFFIDTELILKAKRLGYRLNEVGVRHYPRTAGRSTVRPSDIPRTLLTLMRIARDARRLKPITQFDPTRLPALPEIPSEASSRASQ
jgi:dolichol-phosphate mannosyltransferase